MSTLSQFSGGLGPVVAIDKLVNASIANLSNQATNSYAYTADSGNTGTAGSLNTVLSNAGRGRLLLLGAYSLDATSRTIRLKVTIDGVAAIDATSAAISATNTGIMPVGQIVGASYAAFHPIDYQVSLLVEVASSVGSETNKIKLFWINEEWA